MKISRASHLSILCVDWRFAFSFILFCLLPGISAATQDKEYAHYHISVNSMLTEMQVQLCFVDEVPEAITTTSDVAHRALKGLRINGKPAARRNVARHKIKIKALAARQCLQYRVDLNIARTEAHIARIDPRSQDDILLPVSSWLWLPDIDTSSRRITLVFELPTGINVAAPWQPIQYKNNQYSFEPGRFPADWQSLIAIGRFNTDDITIADTTLRLSILGALPVQKEDEIRHWIEHGATSILNIYGRLPLPSIQIMVVPTGKRDGPVPWGQVLRGGGPAMQLFIDASRPYNQFEQDWTLVHEFSHFLHPKLGMDGAWLSEGLASYYQNIVQARAGTISAKRAWQKLLEGFQRGAAQTKKGRSLAYESRHMSASHHYMRVYWSGAAIALLADFKLRENGQSLDKALSMFQQCCLLKHAYWDTKEFMDKLDVLSNTTIFSKLYSQYAHSDQFPDLKTVYNQLGLNLGNAEMSLDNQADAIQIRRQIMQVH